MLHYYFKHFFSVFPKTYIPLVSSLVTLFLAIFFFPGCTCQTANIDSKIVFKVNNDQLNVKDFSYLLARKLKKFDPLTAKDPETIERAKKDIINDFIFHSLIRSFCTTKQITVSDSELTIEINTIRSTYPDDISFRKTLADEGISFEIWKDELKQTILEKKFFLNIRKNLPSISEEELSAFYNTNKERYKTKEQVYLRQILVNDRIKAQSIKDSLKKSSKDSFESLATKYSSSPESQIGGLLGWVEKGTLEVFDKAFQLPIGVPSDIIESSYGFHILKIEKKRTASYQALDEVKKSIENELLSVKEQAEFTKWLDKQLQDSHVLKDSVLINSIKIETRGPNQ